MCRQIGAEDHGEIWQRDTYFEVANGGLKLREERPGRPHLIQFERADEPQQRESRYRIIQVEDGPMLSAALAIADERLVAVGYAEQLRARRPAA